MAVKRSLGLTGLALALGLGVAFAAPQPQGTVKVVDGDTIHIGKTRIRLHGIDAPELKQTCATPQGKLWNCGTWSQAKLASLLRNGRPACTDLGSDRYGRTLARCTLNGQDIAEQMVADGAAVAYVRYSDAYAGAETKARASGRGMWAAGPQTAPQDYRQSGRTSDRPVPVAAIAGCDIKGNVSQSGRIYHQPGQRDYAATRISATKGEAWFCSPAEAEAAGFRAARR